MFKRMVVVLAVATAFLAGIPARSERPDERRIGERPNQSQVNSDEAKAVQAHQIGREGRRLHRRQASKRQLRKAEQKYLESLSMFRSLNHARGQAELLTDLYILYVDLDENNKANACYEELQHFGRKEKRPATGAYLANMGHFYWGAHAFDKAAEYYEQAVEAYKKAGDEEFTGRTLYDLGQAYRELDQYPEAETCLERSLEIARRREDVESEIRTSGSLGAIHLLRGSYAKASAHCLKAIELSGNRADSDLERNLDQIYQQWSKADPHNEQLNQVKLVLNKIWDREALTQQFSQAIKAKDLEKVKALLAKGANVNVCDRGGDLPLTTAAQKGSMALVRLLLDNGADLDAKDSEGTPALEAAFAKAMLHGREEVARFFLDMGADVVTVGPYKMTPLQLAVKCSADFVKTLLAKGADVNARDAHGKTALMTAASRGELETTRMLLDHGAEVNARSARGETALLQVPYSFETFPGIMSFDHLNDRLEVVKLLLERGADVNVRVQNENTGAVTALLRFSAAGFHEGVELLLNKGAEVNATLNDGANGLFWAMQGSLYHNYPLRGVHNIRKQRRMVKANKALSDRQCETAKLLIMHGIDVNARLKADGSTPLTWAAYLGEADLVRLLLEKGAAMDVRLKDGRTPLLCAVTSGVGFEILKALGSRTFEKQMEEQRKTGKDKVPPFGILEKLGSWSEVNAWRQRNPAPASYSNSRYIDVAKLLLDRGADPNAKLVDGSTALMWSSILGQTDMVRLLLERGAAPNAKLADGSTALQWAALYERVEAVKILAKHGSTVAPATAAASGPKNEVQRLPDQGVDVNAQDAHGTTALMASARGGDLETTRLLLDRGADVRARDGRGWTALNEAVWNDHPDVVTLLLDKGAAPNATDNSGGTALIQAAWNGQQEAVNLLLARGADTRAKDAFGKTAFIRAVEMGHRDVAALLLDKGADVHAALVDGLPLVTAAVIRQDRDMIAFLRKRGADMTVAAAALLGDDKEMQRLVQLAAAKRAQISDAPMALLIATRNGSEDMVKFLLEQCPDIDIRDSCSDTALLCAIDKKHKGIAVALLKKGANPNAMDDWRRSALHYAVFEDDLDLVHILLERGANVNAHTIGWDGAPLLSAVQGGNVEIARALLEKGASLDAGENSDDLMMAAIKSGNKEVLELLKAHGLRQP